MNKFEPQCKTQATWNPPKRTKTVSVDGVVIGELPFTCEVGSAALEINGLEIRGHEFTRGDDRDQAEALINKLLGG